MNLENGERAWREGRYGFGQQIRVGEDLLLDGPIAMDTSFDADLQLESIEFVALSEQLLVTYGERVDFVTWLAGMELDDIIALTVGDVVGFVVSSLGG